MNHAFFNFVNKDGTLDGKNPWDIRNFESYDIPILYLNGSIAGMTKENKVTLNYAWKERSGTLTLKWQGNSSITQFQKRNYTAKFDTAFEVVSGWGAQDKYCFKSNFNDPSQYRNLLCATLWGKLVKSRTPANANLNSLVNGGAVDGFPIIISLNGEFHGLYTWNIPKDAWMFGMTDTSGQQAIVCADVTGDATCFKALADFTDDFELEYSSNDESDWVLTSLNRLISAVKSSDGTNITYGITPYVDWDSVIDYYIHTVLTKGTDATQKNYIMATFDGAKWIFSAYDMDTVFGVTDYGAAFTTADGNPSFANMASTHALFALVWKYMRPQLRARYKKVRETIYNENQLSYLAYSFAAKIPLPVSFADLLKHNRITASSASNIDQILTYFRLRVAVVDKWIEDTSGELDLPTQVDPDAPVAPKYTNQVPISIDTNGTIYNGTGYKDRYRLSSSGAEKTGEYSTVFGYVPAKGGDTIRIQAQEKNGTNVNWYDTSKSTTYICAYDATFKFLYAGTPGGAYTTNSFVESMSVDGTVSVIKLKSVDTIAYIRMNIVGNYSTTGIDGATAIITVNEEITD